MVISITSDDVAQLTRLLAEHGIEVWLDGGWAVDALLGEETRPHDDVDIVLRAADVPRAVQILAEEGFTRTEGGRPFTRLAGARARRTIPGNQCYRTTTWLDTSMAWDVLGTWLCRRGAWAASRCGLAAAFTRQRAGYGFIDSTIPELSIAVVPTRRGSGIGLALLTATLDGARQAGHRAVSLSVEPDNPTLRLYERVGFKKVDEVGGSWTRRIDLGA